MKKFKNFLPCFIIVLSFKANGATCDGNEFLKYDYNYRIGYVAGIYDSFESKYFSCVGAKVKMSQFVDAINNYLKSKPAKRTSSCVDIFHIVIKNEFECK